MINRKESGNFIDQSMTKEMSEICQQINQDEDIYVAVVAGVGDVFSRGGEYLPAANPTLEGLQTYRQSAADAVALEVIGDKKDKFYYVQGCAPAHEIKREDRVIFKSKEEAQSAGYKPATKCE
jgi:enoyl-CoA hydratase/carnithine racemase